MIERTISSSPNKPNSRKIDQLENNNISSPHSVKDVIVKKQKPSPPRESEFKRILNKYVPDNNKSSDATRKEDLLEEEIKEADMYECDKTEELIYLIKENS